MTCPGREWQAARTAGQPWCSVRTGDVLSAFRGLIIQSGEVRSLVKGPRAKRHVLVNTWTTAEEVSSVFIGPAAASTVTCM